MLGYIPGIIHALYVIPEHAGSLECELTAFPLLAGTSSSCAFLRFSSLRKCRLLTLFTSSTTEVLNASRSRPSSLGPMRNCFRFPLRSYHLIQAFTPLHFIQRYLLSLPPIAYSRPLYRRLLDVVAIRPLCINTLFPVAGAAPRLS